MPKIEELVRSISIDGVQWGTSDLVLNGSNVKVLRITCYIEDDKVSAEILENKISEFEDIVQSVKVEDIDKPDRAAEPAQIQQNTSSVSQLRNVPLTRGSTGFGMTIKPGPDAQGVQITVIAPDGVASRSGLLNVGDMIIAVCTFYLSVISLM